MQSFENGPATGGRAFGFPLRGFSLFQGLLLSVSASLITFCAVTMVAIFTMLYLKLHGHPDMDMARSYRDFGLPACLVVLGIALPLFGTLWVRAKLQR